MFTLRGLHARRKVSEGKQNCWEKRAFWAEERMAECEQRKYHFPYLHVFQIIQTGKKILHNREQSKYHQSWGYAAAYRQGTVHIQQQKITNRWNKERRRERIRAREGKLERKNYSTELMPYAVGFVQIFFDDVFLSLWVCWMNIWEVFAFLRKK